jgi:ornithine decarboxylase
MFDHQIVHPFPLTLAGAPRPFPAAFPPNVQLEEDLTVGMGYSRKTVEPASVWGPTCDSIDCVRNVVMLPRELQVGDWLGWGEMGAYTICAASTFNGFKKSPVHYTTGADPEASSAVLRILSGHC